MVRCLSHVGGVIARDPGKCKPGTCSIPARRKPMPYRMAGIDVHKKRLAVVVADVQVEYEYQFERRWYGSHPEQLRVLSEWLIAQEVDAVAMASTPQYCNPVSVYLQR